MKTVKIFISGIVQGVLFRAFIQENAQNLGLTGYVKNLDDGRVEAVLEGYENDVNKMIELCKRGPIHSKIRDIEIEKIENQGFDSFRIIKY
jgi:acylphosphatase